MYKHFLYLLAGSVVTACLNVNSVKADSIEVADRYRIEAGQLLTKRQVKSALSYIVELEPRSQKDLIELTEIPAPPFAEGDRAIRFSEMLREAGLNQVKIDEVGNVIGRRPGNQGNRVVAYSAHLDTVFPEGTDVTVKIRDGRMYAPGIGDNTRGLVQVLTVLRAIQYADIRTEADILFIGNVGEEGLGDLRGMKHLFRPGASRIDTLIAIDGGSTERIVYGGVGSHRYRVTFKGPGGHSWGAFGLANPHHALGRAIEHFVSSAKDVTGYGEKTSYNIGRIGGGTSINSIPFESWMEVDMRSGQQAKLDDIDLVFQNAVKKALREENKARLRGPKLAVEIKRVGTRPAAPGDINVPVVQRALAITQSFGSDPMLSISSTDANLPISIGIPAITMSNGGKGGNWHSPDEWWQNVDGHISIQLGLLTVLAEAGLVD